MSRGNAKEPFGADLVLGLGRRNNHTIPHCFDGHLREVSQYTGDLKVYSGADASLQTTVS
jgi:hypothetical protein